MTENIEQIGASVEAIDQELAGIGGWLILPVIGFAMGLIYFPAMLTVSLSMYSKVAWAGYGSIHAIEPIVLTGLLCFMLYTATLFFRKKSSTPATFIALIIAGLVTGVLLFVIELNTEIDVFAINTVEWLIKGIIKAAICIPYFRVSKRVKATFVN